jgi:hypothetical protein
MGQTIFRAICQGAYTQRELSLSRRDGVFEVVEGLRPFSLAPSLRLLLDTGQNVEGLVASQFS